jgi:hypothetical protein
METVTVAGNELSPEEIAALADADLLEPPYDIPRLRQRLDRANRTRSPLMEFVAAPVVFGVSLLSTGLVYDAVTKGFYRDGVAVEESEILSAIDSHRRNSTTDIRSWTRQLINGTITTEQWAQFVGERIADDHLLMVEVGAGDRSLITPAHLARLEQRLNSGMDDAGSAKGTAEIVALSGLLAALIAGAISLDMALARAERYAINVKASYHESRHVTMVQSGRLAMRRLDPSSRHCPQCPAYDTGNEFIPAEDVVPVGEACACRGNCRCTVIYRRP